MARHLYGTAGGDLVATTDAEGDLVPTDSVTMTVWDSYSGGTQVTDLSLDEAGSSPISVVTPSPLGRVQFYGPDDVTDSLYLEDADGERWRVDPDDITELIGAGVVGPAGPAGPAGATGPAGPAGANGANGSPAAVPIKFRQYGEAAQAVNLLPEVIPYAFTVDGVIATCSLAPTADEIQIDILRDGNSFWTNPVNRPTIPKDERVGTLAIPDNVGPYPAMTRLSMNVTKVGDATSTALTPTVKGYLTGDSGTGSATSFTIPTTGYVAPGGGSVSIAAGDGMLIFIASGQSAGLPGGYAAALAAEAVATNMKGSLAYRTATGTSADGGDVTLGTGSPYSYKVVLISNPGGTEGVALTAPAAGTSAASSALTTTGTDEVGLWFVGWRAGSGAQPHIDITGTGAPTELSDTVTTRTGANTNFGTLAAYKALPTAGTTSAMTYTPNPASNVQFVQAVVAIKSGVGAGTPGENVTGTVWVREYVSTEVGGLE